MCFPKQHGADKSHHLPLLALALGCMIVLSVLWPWFPNEDRVPFGIEGIGQQTVWQSYTFRGIMGGDWNLFAPEILAGYPVWAENEAFPFYPFKAAFAVLPPNQALSLTWIVHFLLWFAGLYLLAWTVTRSVAGGLIAGWVGSFSGPILGTAVGGHLSQFAAFAWLPWMAWAWMKSIRANNIAYAGIGSLCLLLSLMAGHPQYSLMAAAAAFLFAVLSVPAFPGLLRTRRSVLLYLMGFALLAAMAAGWWLLPLNELVSFSNRAGGFSTEILDLGSLHLHQLATTVLPHPYGNAVTSPYVDFLTFLETTCFLGTFPLLLILAGSSFREPHCRSLWLLTALGVLLAAVFVAVPLGHHVELLRRFQLPIRWRLVSWFALSLLCGCGSARLLEGRVSLRRVIIAGSILLFLLACIGFFFFSLGGLESVLTSSGVDIGEGIHKGLLLDSSIPQTTTVHTLGTQAKGQLARAGVFTLLGTFFLFWIVRRKRGNVARPILLCLAVLPGLYGFARPLVQSVSWPRCGWPDPLVSYLKSREGPFRVQPQIPFDRKQNPFPEAYRETYRNFYRYDMTALDWGALVGIESTTGGFSLLTQAYQGLTRIGAAPLRLPGKDPRRKLNARYVLAPLDDPPDGVNPTPLAASEGIGVFEDPHAMPRVSFFINWAEVREKGWGGLRLVRPAEAAPTLSMNPGLPLSESATARALPYARGQGPAFHTEVRSGTQGLAVFSELYYPGFEAEMDGQPVPLCLAWNALMAVVVPPGDHRITIRYRPRIWFAGACVSVPGILGLALLSWVGLRRNRTAGAR